MHSPDSTTYQVLPALALSLYIQALPAIEWVNSGHFLIKASEAYK
jgi:hypothetical protein